MMLRIRTAGTVATLFLLTAAGCTDEETGPSLETEFEATLTGAAERPTPVTTNATGAATVTLNDATQTITYTVNVTGLLTPTMAHIHTGTTAEAGPIVVNLLPTAPAPGTFTGVLATGSAISSQLLNGETYTTLAAKIRAGTTYINVHTAANTSGEIRGQLVPD